MNPSPPSCRFVLGRRDAITGSISPLETHGDQSSFMASGGSSAPSISSPSAPTSSAQLNYESYMAMNTISGAISPNEKKRVRTWEDEAESFGNPFFTTTESMAAQTGPNKRQCLEEGDSHAMLSASAPAMVYMRSNGPFSSDQGALLSSSVGISSRPANLKVSLYRPGAGCISATSSGPQPYKNQRFNQMSPHGAQQQPVLTNRQKKQQRHAQIQQNAQLNHQKKLQRHPPQQQMRSHQSSPLVHGSYNHSSTANTLSTASSGSFASTDTPTTVILPPTNLTPAGYAWIDPHASWIPDHPKTFLYSFIQRSLAGTTRFSSADAPKFTWLAEDGSPLKAHNSVPSHPRNTANPFIYPSTHARSLEVEYPMLLCNWKRYRIRLRVDDPNCPELHSTSNATFVASALVLADILLLPVDTPYGYNLGHLYAEVKVLAQMDKGTFVDAIRQLKRLHETSKCFVLDREKLFLEFSSRQGFHHLTASLYSSANQAAVRNLRHSEFSTSDPLSTSSSSTISCSVMDPSPLDRSTDSTRDKEGSACLRITPSVEHTLPMDLHHKDFPTSNIHLEVDQTFNGPVNPLIVPESAHDQSGPVPPLDLSIEHIVFFANQSLMMLRYEVSRSNPSDSDGASVVWPEALLCVFNALFDHIQNGPSEEAREASAALHHIFLHYPTHTMQILDKRRPVWNYLKDLFFEGNSVTLLHRVLDLFSKGVESSPKALEIATQLFDLDFGRHLHRLLRWCDSFEIRSSYSVDTVDRLASVVTVMIKHLGSFILEMSDHDTLEASMAVLRSFGTPASFEAVQGLQRLLAAH